MRYFVVLSCLYLLFAMPAAAQSPGWVEKTGAKLTNEADAIAADPAGYVYTTGSYTGYTDFDAGVGVHALTSVSGSTDAYILKLDPAGNFRWALSMGGPGEDGGRGISIDDHGNILLTGIFTDSIDLDPGAGAVWAYSHGGTDVYIVKLDSVGRYLWSGTIGGGGNEESRAITTDHHGAVYISGDYSDTMDLDPGAGADLTMAVGNYDIFLIKLNAVGSYLWGMGAGSEEDNESGMSLATDAAGNLYMAGYFMETVDFAPGAATYTMSSHGEEDAFVLKYDSTGTVLWGRDYGGEDLDHATSLALDGAGHVYVTGNYGIGAIFGADTMHVRGAYDAFIMQLDTSGSLLWVQGLGGPEADVGLAVAADAQGVLYVSGVFSDTVDFDPMAHTYTLVSTPSAYYNAFVASYDATGQYRSAGAILCTSLSAVTGLALADGHLCAAGRFLGSAVFDLDGSPYTLATDSGFINSFAIEWDRLPTAIDEVRDAYHISAYPDPAHDRIQVSLPDAPGSIRLEITDTQGKMIYTDTARGAKRITIRTDFPPGVYQLRGVTDSGCYFVTRFTKE